VSTFSVGFQTPCIATSLPLVEVFPDLQLFFPMEPHDDLSDMVEDNLEKKGLKDPAKLDARVKQWIVADFLSGK
jgi:hypothetical protein